MKTLLMTFAALAALPAALILASPAAAVDHTPAGSGPEYKPQKYYWHDDCKGSPGNNLKCIKMRQVIKWDRDEDFDRITISIQDGNWCGAMRISDGHQSWGITPFIITANSGHTYTITRYYIVPAGCSYHMHVRHVINDVGSATAHEHQIRASETTSDHCFNYDFDESSKYSSTSCPSRWPADTSNPNYVVPFE